jgi:FkbM family methyltransferase
MGGRIKSVRCVNGKILLNDIAVDDLNNIISDPIKLSQVFGWRYDETYNCRIKQGIRFRNMRESIIAIFEFGEYADINVKNKVVIDVGAFVGDSAIFFALNGAKMVIAIEPHPQAFLELCDNIKLNSLEKTIIPINAGLSSKPCLIDPGNIGIEVAYTTYFECKDREGTVPVITLKELARDFHIDDSAILKMDCEGCEYDIILKDYEHVRIFEEIIFEYHEYMTKISIKLLLNKLSKDFTCKIHKKDGFGLVKCTKK